MQTGRLAVGGQVGRAIGLDAEFGLVEALNFDLRRPVEFKMADVWRAHGDPDLSGAAEIAVAHAMQPDLSPGNLDARDDVARAGDRDAGIGALGIGDLA